MILELFVVLLIIALAFIGLGLWSDDLRAFGIIGCLFLFLLGVFIILPNNLEVRSGSNVTDVGGGVTTVDYNYVVYNDVTTHYVGYFLAIIGFLGILLVPIARQVEEE
jgi:peptidoglycan/LPS O-acetylase OafA/YrhL